MLAYTVSGPDRLRAADNYSIFAGICLDNRVLFMMLLKKNGKCSGAPPGVSQAR